MLYDVLHFMDPSQIYALPQHINSFGELVIYTKDFAQLMGITPEAVEAARIQIILGLYTDKQDDDLQVPTTIPLKEALLIAEVIK
jgi:hypothetical protein